MHPIYGLEIQELKEEIEELRKENDLLKSYREKQSKLLIFVDKNRRLIEDEILEYCKGNRKLKREKAECQIVYGSYLRRLWSLWGNYDVNE